MKRFWLMILGLMTLAACGGDESEGDPCASSNPPASCMAPVNNVNNTNNANNLNNTNNVNNVNNTNNTNNCVAITECPMDSCGEVDDGCGGTISCGECPCDGTDVVELGCGACDLGVRTCDATGFGTCVLPGDDALASITEEDCDSFVYVNITAGSDGGGAMNSPRNDLNAAILQAQTDGAPGVILAGSTTTPSLTEPIELLDGVHVIGGFDASFERMTDANTAEIAAQNDGHSVGLIANNITSTTVVSRLSLTVADATTWSTGAQIDASSGLILDNVVVEAGAAGSGEAGTSGAPGTDGVDGELGKRGDQNNDDMLGGGVSSAVSAGACAQSDGTTIARETSGKGGCGETINNNGTTTTNGYFCFGDNNGGVGQDTATASGGIPTNASQRDGDNGQAFTMAAAAGSNGVAGASWVEDTNGLWIPDLSNTNGAIGDDGAPGPAGAGGGGATAGSYSANQCGGPGGGSGGVGGCGGLGGTGGEGGWPSVGLILRDSDGIIFDNATFVAGNGGSGADGGAGGMGGAGGNGGQGNQLCDDGTAANQESGDGGDGADGQQGGQGGGGAGGDSIGVFCVAQTLDTTTMDSLNATAGTPGTGGTGGDGAAPSGAASRFEGCDM